MSDGAGRLPAPIFLVQIAFIMHLHAGRAGE